VAKEPFPTVALRAVKAKATALRVILIATDEEWKHVRETVDEVEHALEPPMAAEGFFRRKWETLRHPLAALDLQRSFQNLGRLMRLSAGFESPWMRDLLVSSATMFGFTHGGEFVTGLYQGSIELFSGNVAGAVAWYGLALPGLYDVGCLVGQGLIVVRPTRVAFTRARKVSVIAAGKAVEFMGVQAFVEAIFDNHTAKEQLLWALKQDERQTTFDLVIPDEELLRFEVKNEKGEVVMTLQFEETPKNELVLREATFHKAPLKESDTSNLQEVLSPFRGDVLGAVRQIRKLVRRGRTDLVEHEKTFVSNVDDSDEDLVVRFRDNAVHVPRRWILKDHPHCPRQLLDTVTLIRS